MNQRKQHRESPQVMPISRYLWVLTALLAMLLISALTSLLPLGVFNTVIVLLIAAGMALLVMIVFMHDTPAWRLTGIASAAGFIWLALLIAITLADALTRTRVPAPW